MLKTYNTYHIDNTGEYVTQTLFNEEFEDPKDNWHVLHSVHISEHTHQNRGECDYIILNKRGILVLEVKDKLVKLERGEFFEKDYNTNAGTPFKRMKKNPFIQIDGNQDSIIKFLKDKNVHNVFVSSGVVFPKSTFEYDGIEYKYYWDINSGSFWKFVLDTIEEQKYWHSQKEPNTARYYQQNLTDAELTNLRNIFFPKVVPDEKKIFYGKAIDVAYKKQQTNFNILHGLNENKQILIQGPPGSGKSTYAYDLIKNRIEEHNEKGIYLCWNELLANKINKQFEDDKLNDFIYAIPYFNYIQQLIAESGMNKKLTYDNAGEIKDLAEEAISYLDSQKKLPKHDFIVVDEAQDIFGKGIYSVLDNLLVDEPGIDKGRYYVFYDGKQSIKHKGEMEEYDLVLAILKEHSAIYKLNDNFRAIGGPGIRQLIEEIDENRFDFSKDYGNDVKFVKYADVTKLPETIENQVRRNRINTEDLTVLFSSNLISGNEIVGGKSKPLDNNMPDRFIKLNNENLTEQHKGICYTTALKYKGLEENTIIMVLNDLYCKRPDIVHQFFIGASRAKAQLIVLVDEEPFTKNLSLSD